MPNNEASSLASPPVVVTLPAALVRLFPGSARRVELSATTVDAALDALDSRWPGMRDRVCDSTPRIRRHINVFVGDERATLETRLTPGAEVFIITAISGG
jgi:sulfur-carrier protein